MKRGILCVVFALSGYCCFGQWSLEFTGGSPASWGYFDGEYAVEHGLSLGISSRIKIIDGLDLGIHSNFIFITEIMGTGGGEALRIRAEDCEFLLGFDFLMGYSFSLFHGKYVTIPLTVGFRGFVLSIDGDSGKLFNYPGSDVEALETRYGIGFCLTVEYHFSKRFYLLERVQGGFDFISLYDTTVTTAGIVSRDKGFDYGRSSSLNLQLGIGIQF
jgi:hypothetical protein